MNYLLAGTDAPTIWKGDGTYTTGNTLRVTWRLLWEDRRYVDGKIPFEERNYFPEEARHISPAPRPTDDIISATSGSACPKSGQWAAVDDLNAKIELEPGAVLPQHVGRDVEWMWVGKYYGLISRSTRSLPQRS